jgi:hypothetical protein
MEGVKKVRAQFVTQASGVRWVKSGRLVGVYIMSALPPKADIVHRAALKVHGYCFA